MTTQYRIYPSILPYFILTLLIMILFSACFGRSKKVQRSTKYIPKQNTIKRPAKVTLRTPTPTVPSNPPQRPTTTVQNPPPPSPPYPSTKNKRPTPSKEMAATKEQKERSETWEKPNLPESKAMDTTTSDPNRLKPPTPKREQPRTNIADHTIENDHREVTPIPVEDTSSSSPTPPITDSTTEGIEAIDKRPTITSEGLPTLPAYNENPNTTAPPTVAEPIHTTEKTNTTLPTTDDYLQPVVAPTLPTVDIAVFLPFNLQEYPNGFEQMAYSKKTKLAVEFYKGMLIGLDDLASRSQMNLNVQVFDTQKSEGQVQQILAQNNLHDVDLIIGPIYNAPLKAVANFAQRHQIYQVSPLSPSTRITTNNPYYVMASPPIETHLAAIYDYVRTSYRQQQVLTISDNNAKEINLAQNLHNYANQKAQNGEGFGYANIQHIIYDTSNNPDDLEFHLSTKEENIIVVTSFNELFINKLLVYLLPLRHRYPITLFGMPNWKHMKNIDIDYLSKLNYHTTTHFWKDINSIAQKDFTALYEKRYQRSPSQFASTGYDITTYFGKIIKESGENLAWSIENSDPQGVFSNFDFKAGSAAQYQNQVYPLDYYENKAVHILKYDNYIFKKVN